MNSNTVSPFTKYWLVFKMHWQNMLTYPVSFMFWRFRQFLSTLTSLTFWSVIFMGTSSAFGYSREAMISYIFLTAFLQSVILATSLNGLAEDIYTGTISDLMVRPVKLSWMWITRELADKTTNIFFVLLESSILLLIFHPTLYFPGISQFLIFLAATLLGAILLFFIILMFGVMGFWTQETWGVRFLFYMFIDFTAGKLYPLDILPSAIRQLLFFTPFPYLSYMQTQVFLGKVTPEQTVQMFLTLGGWILFLALSFRYLWKKGLKEYGAVGR